MGIENGLAMAAAVTFAPMHASIPAPHWRDFDMTTASQLAAPFESSPKIVISESELRSLFFRQQVLSPSSPDDARISISISNDVSKDIVVGKSPASLVREFKRLSGVTWAEVSKIFNVSPRAPFDWAAGKVVSEKNHKLLGQAVAVLRYIDRGTGEENKRLLLSEAENCKSYIDLLVAGQFDRIKELVGPGAGRISIGETLTRDAHRFNAPTDFGQSLETSAESSLLEVVPLGKPIIRRAKVRRKKA